MSPFKNQKGLNILNRPKTHRYTALVKLKKKFNVKLNIQSIYKGVYKTYIKKIV